MSTVELESASVESESSSVWRSVLDVGTAIIGIYGLGGIGKTTLLKQIHTKLTTSQPLHDFGAVIWVTVSQNLSIETVQDDIWKKIGVFNVDWVEKSFEEKSKSISKVLSRKKFVLLLDDLGENIDLTEVGVPDPEFNKCKVIFTTRDEHVCHIMGADVTIEMVALEWEHAWELFKNKVGEDRVSDPRIQELAQIIARTCKGLPMLLCSVGRAMVSVTTYDEWFGVLKGLHFQVSDVGDYFLEVDVLNLGYKTVDTLIEACLLEEEQVSYVKLLDLIRDFGSADEFISDRIHSIALTREVGRILPMRNSIRDLEDYVSNNFLTFLLNHNPFIMLKAKFISENISPQNSGQVSSIDVNPPNEDVPSTSGRLSVQNLASSFAKFVTRRKKKSTYKREEDVYQSMTQSTYKREEDVYESMTMSSQVIDTFYQFIDALTVLDLSNSGVEEIPREIANLVSLEYLNLSHTWIHHLPIEIKMLAKLKCLNLEYDEQLRVIPKQLIYKLSSLQVLKMFRCGFSVEEIEDNILSLTRMDIDPILCLEHLKVPSITITCDLALHKFFSSSKFLSCTQSLSLEVFWGCKSLDISPLAAMENLLMLEIDQFEDLKQLVCHPHHLGLARGESSFSKLREISFDECSSLVDVTWVILVPNLAILKVQNCGKMEEVISSRRMGETCNGYNGEPFAKLETLTLEDLPELKSIYWKALRFQYLKKMEVNDCSLLRKLPLDSHSANENEPLIIEAQEEWWEHIEWEDDDSRVTFLPCFKTTV